VIEADAPLAPRDHREDLAFGGLATDHVAHRLRTRLPGRETGTPIGLADQAPVVAANVLQHDVASVRRRGHAVR
jgi:hypothetical protein